MKVLAGDGAGAFTAGPLTSSSAGIAVTGLVAADFNSDGKMDLFAGAFAQTGSSPAVILGSGNGTFSLNFPAATIPSGFNGYRGVAAGDFNGDGKLDVLVTVSSGAMLLALGNGDGTLAGDIDQVRNTFTGGQTLNVAVGDLTGTGALSIIGANSSTTGRGVEVLIPACGP